MSKSAKGKTTGVGKTLHAPWNTSWHVIRALSGGGQGDTLLVKHLEKSLQGVLKKLKDSKARDLKARARMNREVANLRTLGAAGARVPAFYEGNTEQFENEKEILFFVMEWVEGLTLRDHIAKAGPMDVLPAIQTALAICETMRIAIKEGIAHRDIKPDNLVVRSLQPTEIVMLDFGLCSPTK